MPEMALGAALLALVSWVGLAPAAHANDEIREIVKEELAKDNGLRAYWKNGLRFDTADKNIRLKLGGRIMIDTAFYDDDDFQAAGVPASNTEDGFEFRRLRLYNAGLLYDHVEYKLQLDFAGATGDGSGDGVDWKDVYIGLTNLDDCFGCLFPNIRVGHQFARVGLESHTSSKYITFMERSAAVNAFTPARKTGIALWDTFLGDRLGYNASFFSPTSNSVGNGDWDDGYGISGRLWWVPWYECDCECKRLQIGVSYMSNDDLKGKRFRARPPTHMTSRFVDTGTISDVQSFTLLAADVAFVYGPFSLQGEYYTVDVDSVSTGNPTFTGWYGYASWFLTGECRAFKHGTPTRTKPCCNLLSNDCSCWGAFELAARYESLDLQDAGIDGGEMTALTVGVNWYMNPNTRVMLNYFSAEVNGMPRGFDPDGAGGVAAGATAFNDTTISGVQMRFQVDF